MFEKLTRPQKIGALLLIVVLGLVFRLGGLERVGFNEDEVHKVEAARAYLHGDFSNNLEHPMLMKSLIALSLAAGDSWNRGPGRSHPLSEEVTVRLPNVSFGALTALVLFLFAQQCFGIEVGLLTGLDQPYEIIFVDDGSKDRTAELLNEIHESDSRVKVVTLRRNFGQTPALKAGFDVAQGDIIISMDGDLQHDPEEIPAFLAKLAEGYDIVSGWRAQRRDRWLTRRLPSRIANWMMARLARVPLHDFGTTFKAYRQEIIQDLPLYGELHRFIPALASGSGARITEIPINNPPRRNGKSNYGLARTFHVLLDLLSTKFLLDYSTRPLHFFGFFGLLSAGAGTVMGCFLAFKKMVLHQAILLQNGPLMFAATLLILVGVQIICLGLVAEVLSRTYYESQGKPVYAVRAVASGEANSSVRQVREHSARRQPSLRQTRDPEHQEGSYIASYRELVH